MCLPIKFLKTWLSVTTIVTMLGGIGTVIYACVINSQIGEVFSQF